jgi:hypothetical protein
MVAQLIQCPTSDGCPSYSFVGFQNPNNRYGSVTICDWDCCLYGDGITGDSVTIPGYGTLNQPTTATINCDTGDGLYCNGVDRAKCSADPPEDPGSWSGKVDGHITYTALNDCYVKVTGGAGDPLIDNPIGTILLFSNQDIVSSLGEVQSDQYAYSSIINKYCNNSDGSNIFFVLGNPSPDNT